MNAKNKKLLAIVGVAAVLLIVIGVSVSMLGKGDQPSGTDPAAARFSRTTEQTGCKNVTTSRAFLRLRRFPFCPPFPRTNRLHAISESPIRKTIALSIG